MDLQTFVSGTLTQIMDGVKDAKASHRTGLFAGQIAPQFQTPEGDTPITMVEFDVAVTASEDHAKKGGIAVVGGIFALGGRAEASVGNQSVSRIKFKVPLILPGIQE